MNTQTDVVGEFPSGTRGFTPAAIPASQRFYWCVRRELWESRSIYLAPLAVGALIVIAFSLGTLHGGGSSVALPAMGSVAQGAGLSQAYDFAALLLMATTILVAVFYCLEALHGERRDRSILFWKSLPVSDVMAVLSKACIPVLVLPLLTFAITAATQVLMLVLSSAVSGGRGESVDGLGSAAYVFRTWPMLLYHLVAIHGIWYAPIYGWLLLISAWARRAVFLWAALPVAALALLERMAFNRSYFAAMLGRRMSGPEGMGPSAGGGPMDLLTHLRLGGFLFSPGLWAGLAVAAVFLAGAVWLRRSRGSI